MVKKQQDDKPVIQAFIVHMSHGEDLQVDADEMPKVMRALAEGTPVLVRQGIFNPSFYCSVTEDKERVREAWHQYDMIVQHNNYCRPDEKRSFRGMRPLKDIFEGIALLQEIKRRQIEAPRG